MPARKYGIAPLYGRLLRETRPFRPHIAACVLLGLVSAPLTLLMPIPLKIVVDSAIGSQPLPGVLKTIAPAMATRSSTGVVVLAVGLWLAIGVLMQVQGFASSLLRTYTSERLVVAFRARLFRHAQRLSLTYHDCTSPFDAGYRIQSDAPAVPRLLIDGIIPFATAGVTLGGMVGITTAISGRLGLVVVLVSLVLLLVARICGRHVRDQWHIVAERQSSAIMVVHEVLAAIRVVQSFGQEDREQARFVRRSLAALSARIRADITEGGFALAVGSAIVVGIAAALFIGAREVQAGGLTLGELLIVMAYLAQISGPLETLSKMVLHLQPLLASVDRALALLDEVPEIVERPNARPIDRARGAVEFRNVSFAYPEGCLVLHNVSFAVFPGARVGIVGATGAGKTTLLSLLTRFHDPAAGQILLDGIDLRDYRLDDLRRQFAIHLQDSVLFSGSVFENIAYGRPEASLQSVVAAAKAANAHEFIVALNHRYDTRVGEGGARLSGGERQRIALARAYLKDAPILILDEPTSFLDRDTEAAVVDAFGRLMEGRTVFVATHRPGALKACAPLLTIDAGHLSAGGMPGACGL